MIGYNLKSLIQKYDTISFDMFDTLVLRNVSVPEDVFDIVECIYNSKHSNKITDFKTKRIQAYREAYLKYAAFCSIENIYELLSIDENISKEELRNIEEQVEYDICTPNLEMIEIYRYALNCKKAVIITTDMYLHRTIIERILKKCGIEGYLYLFLSSEYGASKTDGKLYDIVIQKLNISKSDMLHIGDGLKNDIIRAMMKGIKTFHVKTSVKLDYNNNKGFNEQEKQIYMIQQNLIKNNVVSVKNEYEKIGFEIFGPLLYGFVQWLHNSILENKISKVFFLAREGLLFKQVYEMLYDTLDIEIHYLYVSRKSLVSPTYWINDSYDDVMNSIAKSKTVSIENQIKRWGLNPETCIDEVSLAGLSMDDVVECRSWDNNEKLKNLFSLLSNRIMEESRKKFAILKQYLIQENFGGKCAIIDIGWNGGMQNAFQKIASIWEKPTAVYGYYMGINSKNLGTKLSNAYGYIYDELHNQINRYLIYSFAGPFELSMTAPHESTINYELKDGVAFPCFGSGDCYDQFGNYSKETQYAMLIQKGIKKYIDISKSYLFSFLITSEVAFRNCREFGLSPKHKHIKIYKKFRANDLGEEQHFVSERYCGLFGKNSFIKGFWTSTWKSAYMKNMFKLPLPYYKLYVSMRKRLDE